MSFKKGYIPWNRGKPQLKETKEKIKLANIGKHFFVPTKEQRQKMSDSHKGIKLSEEHIKKISESLKGKHRSDEIRKKMSEAQLKRKEKVGYIHSPEARKKISLTSLYKWTLKEYREKISESHKGQVAWNKGKRCPQLSGKNNSSWKGGISFEPYGREFNNRLKEQIRKRDNYRCQECFRHQDELYDKNGKKYKLMVHHIDYNKKNNDENNLISLCRGCHSQTNFGRDDWINYYKNKNYF